MRTASVTISSGELDEELRSLARWLRVEDGLRGRINLVRAPIAPDEMGAELEAVMAVVTSGTAGVFVRSLFGWLQRRRDAIKVAVKVRTEKGATIELNCGSADDADVVLKRIRQILDDE